MAGEKVNRTYKDSLFRMIFREKDELLSLYNAVNESSYTNSEDLEIYTIEDVIYMGMKNDVAFLIQECLNLYEAQSTLNPNMPLRGVFYLSDMYKGYIGQNKLDIYSKARLKLPAPKFVVFYNGTESKEERWTERLSDSFRLPEGEEAVLECTALVLNINYGCNKTLMENCRKLYEYSYFVAEVRKKLEAGYRLEAAVPQAIENCIRNDILENFLRRHRMEVTQLILTEYDEELHIKCEKELSREEGKTEEMERGIRCLIEGLQEVGVPREAAFEKVMSKYALKEEVAETYMKKYWKNA